MAANLAAYNGQAAGTDDRVRSKADKVRIFVSQPPARTHHRDLARHDRAVRHGTASRGLKQPYMKVPLCFSSNS